jgi:recombination protein RecA
VAAVIDAEHALDPKWAEKVGVDMESLMISQPDSGEEAITILERLIDSGLVDLVIVDSVAALTPKAVLDGEVGDSTMAALAQLMSKTMNRLKSKCNKTRTTVVFVNQIREKVGIVFGNPEITPGGRALKFYASIRLEVKKGSPIKSNDTVIGFRPSIKVVKNKVAPPFTTGEYDICVGHSQRPVYGIDLQASLIEVASDNGVVKRNGNFYVYNETKLGNGSSNAAAFLREHSEIFEEIKRQTYQRIRVETNTPVVEEDSSTFDESEEDSE